MTSRMYRLRNVSCCSNCFLSELDLILNSICSLCLLDSKFVFVFFFFICSLSPINSNDFLFRFQFYCMWLLCMIQTHICGCYIFNPLIFPFISLFLSFIFLHFNLLFDFQYIFFLRLLDSNFGFDCQHTFI